MKHLVILGSTGSIGQQALEVVRSDPDSYSIRGLGAGTNLDLLVEQVREFQPDIVGIAKANDLDDLNGKLKTELPASNRPEMVHGRDGQETLASYEPADIVLGAVSGGGGLPGSLAALRSGKRLALANKESLLIAGSLINNLLRKQEEAELIPVDSEHSSLFQLLHSTNRNEVNHLYLTASGGPFRTWSEEEIQNATAEEALDHPTWDMGEKITIDSATLMNKAIEVVEAKHLFHVEADQFRVVVHPESTMHAMVELSDGTLLTHMGPTDMKKPIAYSFRYPERGSSNGKSLDFSRDLSLTFESPRTDVFPALDLGFRVAREGGTSGAVLNGANEVAVYAFLDGKLSFPDITRVVQKVLDTHQRIDHPNLDELLRAEQEARRSAEEKIDELHS